MAGEAKLDLEIIYCVPLSHHGIEVWMASEFFAECGNDIAIKITPGVGGIFQVFADGDKIYDKNGEENGVFPNLPRVKELRAALREKLSALATA